MVEEDEKVEDEKVEVEVTLLDCKGFAWERNTCT